PTHPSLHSRVARINRVLVFLNTVFPFLTIDVAPVVRSHRISHFWCYHFLLPSFPYTSIHRNLKSINQGMREQRVYNILQRR
ncbi:hypothetical protein J3R30DRAFT_2214259, partial [Lentinula aciculospora]